jgi:hypothetical protein
MHEGILNAEYNDADKRQVWSAAEYLSDFTRLLSVNSESYKFFPKKA